MKSSSGGNGFTGLIPFFRFPPVSWIKQDQRTKIQHPWGRACSWVVDRLKFM